MMLLCILVLLLVCVASGARCDDQFFISFWWGPTEATQEAFEEAAGAGFNVLMLDHIKLKDMRKALDLCQKLGVKGLIGNDYCLVRDVANGTDKHKCGTDLEALTRDVAGHPATWGYSIIDEPHSSLFPKLKEVNDYLLERDPKHNTFINLFPTYASPEQLGNKTYEEHVDQFCRVVRPTMLSYDHYALLTEGERTDYFLNMEIIRKYGLKYSIPFNFILLAEKHMCYRDPSEAELRWQVYTALAYGAKGIMYYLYRIAVPDPANGGLINGDGSRNRKYYDAQRINAGVAKLGPTLMRLDSVGVYHTAPMPEGTKAIPAGNLIEKVEGGEYVIGKFNSKDGEKYLMLVNRSFRNNSSARVSFGSRVKLHEISPVTGEEKAVVALNEGQRTICSLRCKPGEGRLIRIESATGTPVSGWGSEE